MFFYTSVVSALMLLSVVSALPQGQDDNSLTARGSCKAGYYPTKKGCDICPPGNTCDGNTGPAPCDTGHAAPKNGTTGVCAACPAGTYQDQRGATICIPCPPGSFGPYAAASSCNKAPSGWFQSQAGKSFRCGTCCGWEALQNGNIYPTNCTTTAKPYADVNSGSGCVAKPKTPNCVHAITCKQDAVTGACPASIMSY
ncbi:hypothetical protein C8F04DRAFT_1062946 [Mycena alexandri]|uniref:Tyrosine-protein kinase ephrin type A/B receptor-like domain-containing protein n=1 Tax=Mycena alexandri TaxID=1745969 RepID=A0AAD6TKU4_9AGAR|nr:hypothetical protein C8F04DRAFT_1062946 [Mycena alexandri]